MFLIRRNADAVDEFILLLVNILRHDFSVKSEQNTTQTEVSKQNIYDIVLLEALIYFLTSSKGANNERSNSGKSTLLLHVTEFIPITTTFNTETCS